MIEGRIRLSLDGEEHVLTRGDTASIPAGAVHSYAGDGHYTKVLTMSAPGGLERLIAQAGEPTGEHIFSAAPAELDLDALREAAAGLDVTFVLAAVPQAPDVDRDDALRVGGHRRRMGHAARDHGELARRQRRRAAIDDELDGAALVHAGHLVLGVRVLLPGTARLATTTVDRHGQLLGVDRRAKDPGRAAPR